MKKPSLPFAESKNLSASLASLDYPLPVYPMLTNIEPHLAIEVFPEQEPPPRPTVSIAVEGRRLN